ncbi:integrin alpha-D-like, partial [Oxyura jamaicensis]|uniref:integrin alpha-D-like n=1 Tax=Oxyura jamaicensis TaxID=8884 RepID=UPI0015A603F9
ILVGAPLHRSGTIFRCRPRSASCQELDIHGSSEAVNSSMGLTVAAGDNEALVCGPTVPQACGENVHLNGFCVLLDVNLQQLQRIPASQPGCPKRSSDVALLIDGSGSIDEGEFQTMKTFIAEVMKRFQGTDTQVPPAPVALQVLRPRRVLPGFFCSSWRCVGGGLRDG